MDHKLVDSLHETALDYAVAVNEQAFRQPDSRDHQVARAALVAISHDLVCLHRAVKDLSFMGWAFASPILLRSMLDGHCSLLAVTRSQFPDVSAFKYFYAHTKSRDIDPSFVDRIKKENEKSMKEHMALMTGEDRERAAAYVGQQKQEAYWFQEEFESPTRILGRFGSADIVSMYRRLSSAAHLGFIGTRLFRDQPDNLDINPRPDFRAMGFAMVGSSRLLAEAMRLRASFDGVSAAGYEKVMSLITECDKSGAS